MSTKEDPEFNIVTQRWNYEDEEGQLYEKNPLTNAWMPVIDEEQFKAQQEAYSLPGVEEYNEEQVSRKKRKLQETFTSASPDNREAPAAKDSTDGHSNGKENKKKPPAPKAKDTSVYVQNLPPRATEEELADVFGKCGLILQDSVSGRPRVKIYRDAEGKPKGDALIVYFRPESVSLAIEMLDETSLHGDKYLMRVSKASFEYKKDRLESTDKSARKPVDEEVKKMGTKRAQKMKSKLGDWDDEDVKIIPLTHKFDKIVILKGMFSLDELESDPTLLLDLKEDVREECTRLGQVTNVVLYDKEPDGVISVRYKDEEDAQACIKVMHGRFFGGRQITAELYDGKRKYSKTSKHTNGEEEEQQEEEERRQKFGSWLQQN